MREREMTYETACRRDRKSRAQEKGSYDWRLGHLRKDKHTKRGQGRKAQGVIEG